MNAIQTTYLTGLVIAFAVAFLIDRGLERFGAIETMGWRTRYLLNWARIPLWFLFGLGAVLGLLAGANQFWQITGVLGLTGLLALAHPWLRQVTAGFVIGWTDKMRPDDFVRVGEQTGRLLSVGVTSLRIEGTGGDVMHIPNRNVLQKDLSVWSPEVAKMCRFSVKIPDGMDIEKGLESAWYSAALSPFISPKTEPKVLLVENEDGPSDAMSIEIRAPAFEHQFAEQFRTDVVARFTEMAGASDK